MELSAITHYATKAYCFAVARNKIRIRISVKHKDIEKIVLHYQDKYIPVHYIDTRKECDMELVCHDKIHDFYETTVDIDMVCLRYYFEIRDVAGKTLYYGNHTFSDEPFWNVDFMYDCPQNLREEETFEVPSWAKNKVVYQIFPARFASSKDVPDDVWYTAPIDHKVDLKGDLRGIINHLDYLKNLGIDVIYMTPIFKSSSTHKYNTDDYYMVDPSFGTNDDLKELVAGAHERDMRVILDGVFNHTSIDFFAFKDIMENKENSKYLDWYYIKEFPLVMEWGKRPSYQTFSYAGMMPKLNVNNEEVSNFIIDVAKFWIRECDIDGWRLDVGDEIRHSFWKKFRQEVKSLKKDILISGEIWHYAGDFLEGDEWDTVMNYQFYNCILDGVVAEKITASDFVARLNFMKGNIHPFVYPILWNLIDSHDTARFLYSCKNSVKKHKLAAAFQLLLPGMPMIYYGDEVGLGGGPDPDCRRGMLWDEKRQNKGILSYYQSLLQIRKAYPVITEGNLVDIETNDDKGLIVITKELEGKKAVIIFHIKKDSAELPEYVGMKNLIKQRKFSGELLAYEAAVLI